MKILKRSGFTVIIAVFVSAAVLMSGAPAYAKQTEVSPDASKFLGKLSDSLAEVAEVARPAVVNISTTTIVTMQENPLFNDPFFRRFFGDEFGPQHPRKFRQQALGSGVIVSQDGYILTNNHVVQGASEIKVILYDKREFKGKVVGSDAKTDLAVVKISAKGLPVLQFGDSKKMKTGDIVLAIGNPFGLNQTITMGIVSAVGRSNVGIADYEDFIQTDAAINPGNSGGALVNTSAQLIGINTAIFSTSGGYMGIGFAIPSDMAKSVMESIIKHGRVIRGWLGVSIQNLTPEIAKSLGIKRETGVLVADVVKDSPAEKAGMKRGDLIIEYEGKAVEDSRDLRNMVAGTAPGTTVKVKIIRDGKEEALSVKIEEYQEKKVAKRTEYKNVLKDVQVQELTPSIRQSLNIPDDVHGVVVSGIGEESPAQGVLQKGDVIQEVNRTAVRNLDAYERAVSKIKENEGVLLLVYREGGYLYVTIKP